MSTGIETVAPERLLLVGGRRVATGQWLEVRSPYSGDLVARVARAGAQEARAAIDAAAGAFEAPIPQHERAAILDRIAALVREHREELARSICAEAGKPIKAARVEADRAVITYTFAAVEARRLVGDAVPMEASEPGTGKVAITLRLPVGVVGAITPFNFPLNLVAHKLAPALAAGCPVVLKPASQTPCTALLLAELAEEAGLPGGWLNVVAGPAEEIGDVILEDERVRLLTFTGSSDVGWGLRARAPRKRVSLELGNSTPAIVEADADLEVAAAKIVAGGYGYAGQTCISVQRVLARREIYDELVGLLAGRVEALVVGDPSDDDTDVGPVIDDAARDRLLSWIEEAVGSGARLVAGGTADGRVVAPTLLADVPPGASISCREAFGPVVGVAPYDDLEDALASANSTEYGLQAGIFTRDVSSALRAARALEFGGVTVNEVPSFRADQMPYGGVKASGNTREGPAYAIREMTEDRLVVIQT